MALLAARFPARGRAGRHPPLPAPGADLGFLGDAARRPRPAPGVGPARAPGVRGAPGLELGAGEALPLRELRHGGSLARPRCGRARSGDGPLVPPGRHGGTQPPSLAGPGGARAPGPEPGARRPAGDPSGSRRSGSGVLRRHRHAAARQGGLRGAHRLGPRPPQPVASFRHRSPPGAGAKGAGRRRRRAEGHPSGRSCHGGRRLHRRRRR